MKTNKIILLVILLFLTIAISGCLRVGTEQENPTYPEINVVTNTKAPTVTLTPTQTLTEIPTQTPTITPTPVPTDTPTPTHTATEDLSARPRHPDKEFEKYGYDIAFGNYQKGGKTIPGLCIILQNFQYNGQEITTEGHFIAGSVEYQGEEYLLKARITPKVSGSVVGSYGVELNNKDDVERRLKEGRIYEYNYFFLMDKNTGEPIRYTHPTNFSEEEWFEMRTRIDNVLRNGGRTSELELTLYFLWRP